MIQKTIGKITKANFGIHPDHGTVGLEMEFKQENGIYIDSGTKYMSYENDMATKYTKQILNKANVNFISELIGKTVNISKKDNEFEDVEFLTEIL